MSEPSGSEEAESERAEPSEGELLPPHPIEPPPPQAIPSGAEARASDGPFAAASPATGERLGAVEATSLEAIANIVGRAREAQSHWAATPIAARVKAVSKLKKRILRRAEEIAKLVHDETGKPEVEALLGEVLASADVVHYWAELIVEELAP